MPRFIFLTVTLCLVITATVMAQETPSKPLADEPADGAIVDGRVYIRPYRYHYNYPNGQASGFSYGYNDGRQSGYHYGHQSSYGVRWREGDAGRDQEKPAEDGHPPLVAHHPADIVTFESS